jgi:hypothetical protein
MRVRPPPIWLEIARRLEYLNPAHALMFLNKPVH